MSYTEKEVQKMITRTLTEKTNSGGNIMRPQEIEMRGNRTIAIRKMEELLETAQKEKRELSNEENRRYEQLESEADNLDERIKDMAGSSSQSGDARSFMYRDENTGEGVPASRNFGIEQRDLVYDSAEKRDAFKRYIREGVNALDGSEYRALQVDDNTAGGYIVLPMQLSKTLIAGLDNLVFIRKLATIYPCKNSESLGAATLDNDLGDPTWTAEIATGDDDSTMSFGKRELTPHPLARRIKVSNKLMRAAYLDAESIVIDRFTQKMGIVQENGFMNGNGSGQPLGVFTASDLGISTDRDVSEGNTETEITTDGLINALYSLKSQYRKNAQWVFSREALKKIRKLKDGDGNYLWLRGFTDNRPDTILGLPYNESEYCPNTFESGKYVGILGDFSKYWIAEALNMQIQRLVELYAEANQTGFIGRAELDAMPVDKNAFSRVTLA